MLLLCPSYRGKIFLPSVQQQWAQTGRQRSTGRPYSPQPSARCSGLALVRMGRFYLHSLPNYEEYFLILLIEVERKEVLLDSTIKNVFIHF